MSKRRLAETGRAEEQHVIERFAALACGLDEDLQLRAYLLLADVFFERLRPQRTLERLFLWRSRCGGDQAVRFDHRLDHAFESAFSACRMPSVTLRPLSRFFMANCAS